MKRKNAQIQLGESIFVVIIIILLIIFGIVFFSQAQKESIVQEQEEFKSLETITITQYVSSLTEIQCSLQNVEVTTCYDETKLDAFKNLLEEVGEGANNEAMKEFYFSQLGNSKITITKIYPEERDSVDMLPQWTIYDNEPQTITTQARADLAVSLFDPIERTHSFGTLTIIQYR